MEKVIDRKEYRRDSENYKLVDEDQVNLWQRRIRKILFQAMGAASVLLIISFLKFFNCTDTLTKIEEWLIAPIQISSFQKSGQRLFEKATEYYIKLNGWVESILQEEKIFVVGASGDKIRNQMPIAYLSGDVNLENISWSGEKLESEDSEKIEYEMAVEGMNQMLEDANYIKENYKMTNPIVGTITSEFGVRNSDNPIVSNYHSGLDIAANSGTQILAALGGKVIEASTDTYYGKYLKIQKDDVTMLYAHCSKLLVEVGETVNKGELIAYVGNTGNSTGPHLHFELKYKDRLVNPLDILEI